MRFLMVAFVLVCSSSVAVAGHHWKDATGKHSIEAELVRLSGANVWLRKTDGSIIAVPRTALSQPDQKYASQLEDPQTRRMWLFLRSVRSLHGEYLKRLLFVEIDGRSKAKIEGRLQRVPGNFIRHSVIEANKFRMDKIRALRVTDDLLQGKPSQTFGVADVGGEFAGLLKRSRRIDVEVDKLVEAYEKGMKKDLRKLNVFGSDADNLATLLSGALREQAFSQVQRKWLERERKLQEEWSKYLKEQATSLICLKDFASEPQFCSPVISYVRPPGAHDFNFTSRGRGVSWKKPVDLGDMNAESPPKLVIMKPRTDSWWLFYRVNLTKFAWLNVAVGETTGMVAAKVHIIRRPKPPARATKSKRTSRTRSKRTKGPIPANVKIGSYPQTAVAEPGNDKKSGWLTLPLNPGEYLISVMHIRRPELDVNRSNNRLWSGTGADLRIWMGERSSLPATPMRDKPTLIISR